jgi:hypothetical protein
MYTYPLRLLVAVVTFTVGLAVSSIPFLHPAKDNPFSYRHRRSCSERYFEPPVRVRHDDVSEPLRVTYLGSDSRSQDGDIPTVRLLVQNLSGRDVTNFSVNYFSGWRHSQTRGSGSVQSDVDTRGSVLHAGESTMLEISATQGQLFYVWLSSVEFADGSNWKFSL